jgi:hypothetical protein
VRGLGRIAGFLILAAGLASAGRISVDVAAVPRELTDLAQMAPTPEINESFDAVHGPVARTDEMPEAIGSGNVHFAAGLSLPAEAPFRAPVSAASLGLQPGPEPGTMLLMGGALTGLSLLARKRLARR